MLLRKKRVSGEVGGRGGGVEVKSQSVKSKHMNGHRTEARTHTHTHTHTHTLSVVRQTGFIRSLSVVCHRCFISTDFRPL